MNPDILQAEILFFIFSFQCHSLLCSFCLLPIFRWTAEMLKFKPHEYTSYKTITKTVLIQYLPTYPSYIKAKPSDCLTQRRLPCKYDWNSAQSWEVLQELILETAAHHQDVQGCLELNSQLTCQHKGPRTILWKQLRIQGVMWKLLICSSWRRGSTIYQLHTERGAGRVFWITQASTMEKGREQPPFMH